MEGTRCIDPNGFAVATTDTETPRDPQWTSATARIAKDSTLRRFLPREHEFLRRDMKSQRTRIVIADDHPVVLECLDRLRMRNPDVKVVMLASQTDPETVAAAFEHGACGFIVKNVQVADLGPSIHTALNGGAYRPYGLPAMTDALVAKRAGLSKREFDILRAVARGLSNREIAHELWISEPTVKFHLTSVYRKLDVPNRTAAARCALDNGIHQGERAGRG
ncbi:MAG: response regulator transcription factor [Gaiellaceae bacterium]